MHSYSPNLFFNQVVFTGHLYSLVVLCHAEKLCWPLRNILFFSSPLRTAIEIPHVSDHLFISSPAVSLVFPVNPSLPPFQQSRHFSKMTQAPLFSQKEQLSQEGVIGPECIWQWSAGRHNKWQINPLNDHANIRRWEKLSSPSWFPVYQHALHGHLILYNYFIFFLILALLICFPLPFYQRAKGLKLLVLPCWIPKLDRKASCSCLRSYSNICKKLTYFERYFSLVKSLEYRPSHPDMCRNIW